MLEKLKELALRYEDLQAQLADPSVYGRRRRTEPRRRSCSLTRRCGSWPRRS